MKRAIRWGNDLKILPGSLLVEGGPRANVRTLPNLNHLIQHEGLTICNDKFVYAQSAGIANQLTSIHGKA